MAESTQHKLDRNRPPRVHITYDVETAGGIQKTELPFVVGIMSDLAGKAELPRVKDRKFINIDRDNFNEVMTAIGPEIAFRVPDKLSGDPEKQLPVQLKLKTMDDFDPVNIVNQVDSLKKLFDARQRLRDLMAKLDGNDDLDKLLQEIAANDEQLKELQATIGGNGDGEEH